MRIARRSSLVLSALTAAILSGGVALVGAHAMPGGGWWGFVPAVLVAYFALRRPLRRRRVAARPMPRAWQRWLAAHVPFYRGLGPEDRQQFERDVQFFIDEHAFEGVEGVEVTDELRLSVGAGAALLLHGRPGWELPAGRSIIFYPDRFDENYYGGDYAAYDGMVHEQGPVLLSAQATRESWEDAADGSNVVLHELAHLFDFKGRSVDGVPSLVHSTSEASWQQLVCREMRKVRRRTSILRPYAATAPSEFFAVAVEAFFEQPGAMQDRHPELYEALTAFFNLDPRGRVVN